jgi:hypothetical protein
MQISKPFRLLDPGDLPKWKRELPPDRGTTAQPSTPFSYSFQEKFVRFFKTHPQPAAATTITTVSTTTQPPRKGIAGAPA